MERVEITCFVDELNQFEDRTDITSLTINIKHRSESVFKNLDLDWLKPLVNLEELVISGFGNITNTDGLLSLSKLKQFHVKETYIGDLTTLRNNLDLEAIVLLESDVETYENIYLFCGEDLELDVDISGLDVCKKMTRFVCHYHIKNKDVIASWNNLKSLVLKREIKPEDMKILQSLKNLRYITIKNSDIDLSQSSFPSLQYLDMISCTIHKSECIDAPNLETVYIRNCQLVDFRGFNYDNHPNIKIDMTHSRLTK